MKPRTRIVTKEWFVNPAVVAPALMVFVTAP
ncbi:hypothetical protein C5L31_000056 [Secundilactobacillus malefermentans]|uniref:Uncharacterized protein n=1 Tax=Secundilactobacillus malefermentans TaxID=176292 RepID=A0A4R5NIJ4_9LACO|nr:hypothetical protein C5L31_000056 [Secundilactobacillus malefermentans]